MSSSSSSSSEPPPAAPSTVSKPRIRISMPSSTRPTPVRPHNEDVHHKVSPTPLRTDAKPPATKPIAAPPQYNREESRPELSPRVLSGLRHGDLEFPINEECTSLKIIPSGRLIVAGFTDGTLRLFDLDGGPAATSSSSPQASAESEDELSFEATTAKNNALVCSKAHQRYGAVACQIHARGVHTSLLMHVDCSEDGLYCFGGVIRGSMELVAVDISNITNSSGKDLLDLIRVHRHSDAKLKGFGACTRLQGETQKYLLLTGKGIKNIHIWSFEPTNPTEQWQCLYDTQTNGNTISILHWRYDPNGLLQAMSKSDSQKLRVWDLSHEQHGGDSNHPLYHKQSTIHQLAKQNTPFSKERPKRPPYVDVASTESALGICGSFCFGGGYNQVSVVSLDVENVGSPYNHTEMALPGGGGSRRRQRGDLQSIVRVAGMTKDAGHVLLELSNGSVVHYLSDPEKSASRLEALPSFQSEEGGSRNLCLERIGASGLVVAAMSTYFASSGRGNIVLRPLDKNDAAMTPAADKTALAAATVGSEAPSPNQSIQLFGATPKVASKKKKKRKHLAVVDAPVVTAQTKEPVAARVSVDNNAGHDPSTKTPEGAAVSPEQRLELTNVPKQKTKKNGAMMKYLRPAEEGKAEKTSQVHTPTLPRRLHQEPGSMKPKHLKGNVKKMPAAVSSKKSRTKTPPKGHLLYDSEKQARKLEDASNLSEQPSKPAEKVKAKRVRSPCVPRKRQHHKSSVTPRPASSQRVSRGDTLLDVAETLCDIRRGTPSPKRARPNTGRYAKKTPVEEHARPSHPHRKRPRALASQLPKISILERIGGTQDSAKTDSVSLQEASRMKLAAEHRAGHELLRKRVLSTVDCITRSLSRSDPISDSEARIWFNEEIHGFKDMLEDMLARQRMEASSLAAEQTLQQKGYTAPEMQVSFPFPDLFDTVSVAFERFMDEEKTSL